MKIRPPANPVWLRALVGLFLWGSLFGQLPLPRFSKLPLLNGMEVLIMDPVQPTQEKVDFVLMIRNGAAFDPVEKFGSTYLLTQLLMEGSERRTGEQLRTDLASLGASIEPHVEWDAIFFHGSAPPDRLDDTLDLLGEIIVRPGFKQEAFDRLKKELQTSLENDLKDRRLENLRRFRKELFGQNPYGHLVRGNPETVANLTLVDMKIQYRRLFLPNETKLALYYPGDSSQLLRVMGRAWGGWIREEPLPFTFRQAEPPSGRRILLIDDPEADDGLLRFGTLAARFGTADYYTLKVLEHYITLSLPDWARDVTNSDQVRATVDHQTGRMPGRFVLRLASQTRHLAGYFERFLEFLEALRAGQIQEDRLREARELALLEVRGELENPRQRLQVLLTALLNDQGISYFAAYGPRLERVDAARLQAVAERYFPANSYLAVVTGKASELKPLLEKNGTVEILN